MRFLRSSHQRLGINPERIAVVGSSAGTANLYIFLPPVRVRERVRVRVRERIRVRVRVPVRVRVRVRVCFRALVLKPYTEHLAFWGVCVCVCVCVCVSV